MNKIKQIRSMLIIAAALGWWGMWFPELAVWGGAVRVTQQEYAGASCEKEYQGSSQEQNIDMNMVREIYSGLQQADRSQIRIKSKLLAAIDQYLQTK